MATTDNLNELFIVVDKNDTIRGYKTRAECHSNPSLIHRAVGVLVFNDRDELLLQKRSKTKDRNPGLWTLSASGHVTKGQTYQEAAERELYEEIGIYAPLEHLLSYHYYGDGEQEMAVNFRARHNGPFVLDPREVAEVQFFPVDKIPSLIKKLTPCTIDTLRRLQIIPQP